MEGLQGSLFSTEVLQPQAPKRAKTPTAKVAVERKRASEQEQPWIDPLPMVHPKLRLGLCSFTDPDWRGTFYGESEGDLLAAYTKRLNTVEVDSTFYGVPKAAVVDSWAARTPSSFRFCLKFPREITHDRMLEGADYVTKAFLDVTSRLGERLGPLLLQFPYSFRATHFPHLVSYLEKLPKNFRYALEVRHRSWLRQPFFQLLEDHQVSLCMVDHPLIPRLEKRTSNFFYVRWLGDRRETPGPFLSLRRDPAAGLRWWLRRLSPLIEEGHEVYAFANNQYAGHAPATLRRFVEVYQKGLR